MTIHPTIVKAILVLIIVRIATMAIHAAMISYRTAIDYAAYNKRNDALRKQCERQAQHMNN